MEKILKEIVVFLQPLFLVELSWKPVGRRAHLAMSCGFEVLSVCFLRRVSLCKVTLHPVVHIETELSSVTENANSTLAAVGLFAAL